MVLGNALKFYKMCSREGGKYGGVRAMVARIADEE